MTTWAVVPSRDRHRTLMSCLAHLMDQVDGIVVIDTGLPASYLAPKKIKFYKSHEQGNISSWWNQGLDIVQALDPEVKHVAFVNDDAMVPPGWVLAVTGIMQLDEADICWTLPSTYFWKRRRYEADNSDRMTGWAWMLDVSSGLRLDESMKWWFSDNDIEWQSYQKRGAVVFGFPEVKHLYPNVGTNESAELTAQAGRDREAFLSKWGRLPL